MTLGVRAARDREGELTLFPVQFTKAELDGVPESERNFYLLGGQLCNELNILRKLLLFALLAADRSVDEHPRHIAAISQALLMARVIAGRMHEGWKWLTNAESGAVIQQYQPRLKPHALAARTELGKYFGQANLVSLLRNKAAFHIPTELASEAWGRVHDAEKLADYIGATRSEAIYGTGEVLSAMTMVLLAGDDDTGAAIARIGAELPHKSMLFEDYIHDLMRVFLGSHFRHKNAEIQAGKIILKDVPPLLDTELAFFCVPPQHLPKTPPPRKG